MAQLKMDEIELARIMTITRLLGKEDVGVDTVQQEYLRAREAIQEYREWSDDSEHRGPKSRR